MLNHVRWVDSFRTEIGRSPGNPTSRQKTHRAFLVYKELFAAQKPVILCEGKTDHVYLTCAIRALAGEYPALAQRDAKGHVISKVRQLRCAGRATGRELGLNGGTGDIRNFIRTYVSVAEKFKAPGARQPVIVVIDNDSGAKTIASTIKEITKVPTDLDRSFTHVWRNLYVVATPKGNGGKDSAIEDHFDAATLGVSLGGKTFSRASSLDDASQFGKTVFAHQVVRAREKSIDFSGFAPLLERIVKVIEAHAAQTPS